MSRVPKAAPGTPLTEGPRRFSALGNLVLDGDRQDVGWDPEVATCEGAECARLLADMLEENDRNGTLDPELDRVFKGGA